MLGWIARYTRWLHTRWPAGGVEKLPVVGEYGSTNVRGLHVVGDLTGVPLLKFSVDTGARAIGAIAADPAFKSRETSDSGVVDVAVIGGGVSGFAAALEAERRGLSYVLYEATEPFSTIVNFPRRKPIYTYPTDMTPAGSLRFHEESDVKEGLLDDLRAQTLDAGIMPVMARVERVRRAGGVLEVECAGSVPAQRAHRVVVAIGRSGNFRRLGVEGEGLDKVFNRLHDPRDHAGREVLVVGGGDSALEAATALATCGARVTLSYRGAEFARPRPGNVENVRRLAADPAAPVMVERPVSDRVTTAAGRFLPRENPGEGSLRLLMQSRLERIGEAEVVITTADGEARTFANEAVFSMIGREAPLDFFRRSGVHIRGEWRPATVAGLVFALFAAFFVYDWKKSGVFPRIYETFLERGWFPFNLPEWWAGFGGAFADRMTLLGTLRVSLGEPGFWYSLAYCLLMLVFGVRRVRRRRTPYVKVQTFTLVAVQMVPLFLLPYLVLPYLGYNGFFDGGLAGSLADEFFPAAGYGHGREYWRAFGLILAWPLFFWNVFTEQPLAGWLVVSFVQTFVIIPLIIRRWGKGAYCGWICSCGGLAETLGDAHRHKMPHGPIWNRLNMLGQLFLALAFLLLATRILSWLWPGSFFGDVYAAVLHGVPAFNYVWFVDLLFAGIIGVGLYFHFSGRTWCRFACPLAALMHVYARFSRFRILADKKKCISCNVCTTVCHQGIDVMSFANKGVGMEDPECVRCSACVGSCPTGVLEFGRVNDRGETVATDRLAASPVRMAEEGAGAAAGLNRRLFVSGGAILVALVAVVLLGRGDGTTASMPAVGATSRPTSGPSPTTPRPRPAPNNAVPAAQRTTTADHAALDAVLREVVRGGLVDYAGVRADHAEALDRYIEAMRHVDHERLAKWDRYAFYVNLYNAIVIRTVAERLEPGYSAARDDYAIFKEPLVQLADRRVSLDELEKRITWDAFGDPRMHVAFVCAAVSCPPILARAYRGDDMDEVLEENMRRFVVDPTRNPHDLARRTLRLSKIFEWYASDFGGRDAVVPYVDRHHPADLSGFATEYVEYDWTLNATPK